MKKAILFLLILLLFTGCAGQEAKTNTLWVVTELSNSDGMNYQADVIANRMMEKYPGLEIKLDILPTDPGEREIKLKHLRTQIMSGKGPDVYLLPTGTELVSDEPQKEVNVPIEPLFADVNQAMRLGVFLDLTEYYNADEKLNVTALNHPVMEAGILNGKRYVLPLRYQIPTVYARLDLCQEYGITEELLNSDYTALARYVLSLEDAETAAIGLKFPEVVEAIAIPLDYKKGEILVSQEQISEYLILCQQQKAAATESTQSWLDKWDLYRRIQLYNSSPASQEESGLGAFTEAKFDHTFKYYSLWPAKGEYFYEYFSLLSAYTSEEVHWSTSGIPFYTDGLSNILENLGVEKITGQDIQCYPIRSTDGEINARVSYWGAVGSSCANPDLGYEFLRQFLDEEFQWDLYRPRRRNHGVNIILADHDPQYKRLVEDSIPVRTLGCVEPLWDNLKYQVFYSYTTVEGTETSVKTIRSSNVTADEVPELNWEIDYAYFPVDIEESLSLAGALEKLNNPDGTPTDVNIEELAEEVYQNLWWHLAEG